MERFRDYVARATRLLRGDPAVHWDVSRELEVHLEDAAEAARAEGADEAEAERRALEACGDAEALSDQLWLANRDRMRLRAAGKWFARLVLVPGAVVLAVATSFYGFGMGLRMAGASDPLIALVRGERPRPRRGLSAEQRWLYEQVTAQGGDSLARARAMAARFPDDPVLHAHYLRTLGERAGGIVEKGPGHALWNEWMALLEDGRRVDPENAVYDYMLAWTLLMRSTEVVDEEGITFAYRPRGWGASDEPVEAELPTLRVTDAETFARAVQAARTGFRKPTCTGRGRAWAELQESLWAEPRTYQEKLVRVAYHAALLMPQLHPLRELTERLPGSALLLGEQGRREDAVELALNMHRIGVYASILRDIQKRGDESRFRKVAPGKFALAP